MGNTNTNQTQPPNTGQQQDNKGFLSSFMRKKKQEPVQEEDEWGNFMNQQNTRKNMIYSNCNQTLNNFDGKKTAEGMKIVEKQYTKTKFHFWVKNEMISCSFAVDGKFVNIKINIEIESKDVEVFKNSPAVLSVFLFGREIVEETTNKFKGIAHGTFYEAFAHVNHQKLQNINNLISKGMYTLLNLNAKNKGIRRNTGRTYHYIKISSSLLLNVFSLKIIFNLNMTSLFP
jgi:hypothetical protein